MGLFSLAFRRSAGSLWLAAALSLLFSLVFLLVYAAGDVLEGVYADAVMSQNTYTFTLKTRDISKFSDTSMLAYTVEAGRDYNVGLSANGRSALLTRQSRGITISLAGAAFDAARPDAVLCGRGFSEAEEGDIWLSVAAAAYLFGEEDDATFGEALSAVLGESVCVGGRTYRVAGVLGFFFSVYLGAAEPSFAVFGGEADEYYAAVPAAGLRAAVSLLGEGEYAEDGGAVQLVRGFGLLEAGVRAVAVLACAFALLLAARLVSSYFVSKERQNGVLRLCGAHRFSVFAVNLGVLAAAGLLSLALSVPLFYAWRAAVEAISRAVMGSAFGAAPPLWLYLPCAYAAWLALAAAVCARRCFARRGGEVYPCG